MKTLLIIGTIILLSGFASTLMYTMSDGEKNKYIITSIITAVLGTITVSIPILSTNFA